jgi:NAD-specific glutamate dehydrogenase
MSLKWADRENVSIPTEWENFENKTISKHSLRMMRYYKSIPISPVPVTENGIDHF